MAELGLARSLVALHRQQEASEAYAALIGSWAHADPDLTPLVEAKREAAKLNQPAK
jgi:hypothetical protein